MKNCFIVIGYTPTYEKEKVLENLLIKLKRDDVPIILLLHNIPSKRIIELTDYFIYDKDNPLLINHKDSHAVKWVNFGKYKLSSYYDGGFWSNHGLAGLKMIWEGLSFAKNLGYSKSQLFIYDTDVSDFNVINENFNLLDNYDFVGYTENDPYNRFFLFTQYMSFNLEKFTYDELNYSICEDKIRKEFKEPNHNGMGELIFSNILVKEKNYLLKESNILSENGINIDLINPSTEKNIFSFIPFEINDSIHIFIYNFLPKDKTRLNFKIIVNDTDLFIQEFGPYEWSFFETNNTLENLKTIEFFINNKFILKYDFINEINKEHFRNTTKFKLL